MKIPVSAYVKREMAYLVITEFISTKSLPAFVQWIDLFAIDFEHPFDT